MLQLIGEVRSVRVDRHGLAAFAGGFVASEWITAWRTIEPVWDGMALIPAIGAALVVG